MTDPDALARWLDERDRDADRALELRHEEAAAEEWLFTCWSPTIGIISGYRIVGRADQRQVGWYWGAVAGRGEPLVHVADWSVRMRSDPLLVKGDGLWAEHTCDAPMEQWTVANETYATALDDPDDALGRAYGAPTAVAFDIEWYATAPPQPVDSGYSQAGVVHGVIELAGTPGLHLEEVPGERWHRWGEQLDPVSLPEAFAHSGVRAPFAFPDGTVADWALTPDGWRARRR